MSEATFLHAQASLARMDLVSEDAIRDAMRFAHEALGLSIEGSAAVSVAWVRAHHAEVEPPLVAVVTGANVDPAVLREILR